MGFGTWRPKSEYPPYLQWVKAVSIAFCPYTRLLRSRNDAINEVVICP